MTVIGFHCSHEQIAPAQLLRDVQQAAWLREYLDQGWDELYLHFVGKQQARFIDAFGQHVLPQLSPTAPEPRGALP